MIVKEGTHFLSNSSGDIPHPGTTLHDEQASVRFQYEATSRDFKTDLTLGKDRIGLKGVTAAGSGTKRDPKLVAMQAVIDRLNDLFGDEDLVEDALETALRLRSALDPATPPYPAARSISPSTAGPLPSRARRSRNMRSRP